MQKSTIVLIVIAVLIVFLGAALLFIFGSTPPSGGDTVSVEQLLSGIHHTKGSSGAPVVIVEFGDFQCPSCGAAYPVVSRILNDFGDKIYFVYRHFPLAQHEFARSAASASEAAAVQGKFWEMYDQLYQHQDKLDETSIRGYATSLGLDMAKFESDWKSQAAADIVTADAAAGAGFKVSATPTFFINGQRFVGALSYDQFRAEITKLLSAQSK
ncbi:MAG: DsbA family protein [Patescibacteria group bacterium]|nr:DsbA family protein [Patescibacteria group bacterium]